MASSWIRTQLLSLHKRIGNGGYGQSIEAPLCFYFLFILHLCASVWVQSFRSRLFLPELPTLSELSIPMLQFGMYLGDLLCCSAPWTAGEQPAPPWACSGLQETSAPHPEHFLYILLAFYAAFCTFLYRPSPRCCYLGCWAQQYPALEPLQLPRSGCVWHWAAPASPHSGCHCSCLLAGIGFISQGAYLQ